MDNSFIPAVVYHHGSVQKLHNDFTYLTDAAPVIMYIHPEWSKYELGEQIRQILELRIDERIFKIQFKMPLFVCGSTYTSLCHTIKNDQDVLYMIDTFRRSTSMQTLEVYVDIIALDPPFGYHGGHSSGDVGPSNFRQYADEDFSRQTAYDQDYSRQYADQDYGRQTAYDQDYSRQYEEPSLQFDGGDRAASDRRLSISVGGGGVHPNYAFTTQNIDIEELPYDDAAYDVEDDADDPDYVVESEDESYENVDSSFLFLLFPLPPPSSSFLLGNVFRRQKS